MSAVLSFPSLPGRLLATIEIIRMPDGRIAGQVVQMAAAEIEAEASVSARFDKVIGWLQPIVDSLKQQAASFEDPKP